MIEVADLSVSFGERPVLSDVDLSVDRGTLLGLVGPNGGGKTTLLRTLQGTLAPDSGTVHVADEPIHDISARRASRLVASVPQSTALSFEFTVEQTVEMGRTPHVGRLGGLDADDREAIRTAMERTQVRQFADRPITAVSGGERQRVLLARALAQETPVLVLDEPTANLDVNHAIRTLELVSELVADGKTVVAAIHDLNLAARYCDRLALLADETVQSVGSPADVLTTTQLRETFDSPALITDQPADEAPLVTAVAEPDAVEARVHVVGTGTRAATAVGRLVAAGFEVTLGVAPAGDAAAARAVDLDCETITVPPFADIDEAAQQQAITVARRADVIVVVDEPSAGNRPVAAAGQRVVAVDADGRVAIDADGQDWGSIAGDIVTTSLEALPRVVSETVAAGSTADDKRDGTQWHPT